MDLRGPITSNLYAVTKSSFFTVTLYHAKGKNRSDGSAQRSDVGFCFDIDRCDSGLPVLNELLEHTDSREASFPLKEEPGTPPELLLIA